MPSPSLNRRSDLDRRFQQPFRYTGLDDYWWRYDPIHIVSPVPFLQMRDGRPSISGSTPAFGLPSTSTGNAQYNTNARLFGSEGTILWSGTVQSNTYVQPLVQIAIDFSADNYIAIQANNAWNGTAEFIVRTSAVTRVQVADNVSLTGGGNAVLSGGPSGTFCCVNGSLRNSSSNTLWASGFSTTTNRVVSINYANRGSSATSTYPWAIVAWFGRQIPQHEALELSRNPYLLFRPEASDKPRFYSLPSQGASTQTLTAVGNIASAEAFGTAAFAPGAVTVAGAGAIASGEAFGDAVVSAGGTLLSAVGNIASAEAFGTATLVPGAVSITSAGAISSAEAFGTSTLSVGATLVTGVGNIASGETFGAALITSGGAVVTGAGNIASGETFGSSTVAPGAVSVTNAGAIASGEVFGTAALARGAVTLSSAGAIASGEAFGDPLIAGAGVFIQSAGGIASGEAFGPVPLIPQAYVAPDVRALEVLGGGRILEVAGGRRILEVAGGRRTLEVQG